MNLVTRNSLVSTARPNKNKVCAEKDEQQLDVFSYVSPEQRVLHDHPLRSLRAMSDDALQQLRPRLNKLYAKTGRPSIALVSSIRGQVSQSILDRLKRGQQDGDVPKAAPIVALAATTQLFSTAWRCNQEMGPRERPSPRLWSSSRRIPQQIVGSAASRGAS